MLHFRDNLNQSVAALRAYKLRAVLTMLGLTMGVATIITVITLIQGANLYVEEKVANLGTNVFQVSRLPFAVTDFTLIIRALRNRYITLDERRVLEERCPHCQHVGARATFSVLTRNGNRELPDTAVTGQTASMGYIDSKTVVQGRFFTELEDIRGSSVCVIGWRVKDELFAETDPLGRTMRVGDQEFVVIGVYEKIGSVLGQDQDNFLVIPLTTYRKMRGARVSLVLEVKAAGGGEVFEQAQDEARLALRALRQRGPKENDDFFIGTAASYIELYKSISSGFFAVFILVSAISSIVGGIVIMNVMLVSVTERTKEIGVRRAVGATEGDILRQFLWESVFQCLIGGAIGILAGFGAAVLVRTLTSFPASVQPMAAAFGFLLSTGIGLFFGIYPATRAAKLDPVTALRSE